MKQIFTVVLLSIFCFAAHSQSLKEVITLVKQHDTVAAKSILDKWEKKNEKDRGADFYIAAYNYHGILAKKEVIGLTKSEPEGESFSITDENDTVAGYLGSHIYYEAAHSGAALKYISDGIKKYPGRLDMRFGKIYFLGEVGDYTQFTNEVIAAVEYGDKIKYKWFWSEGKLLEDSRVFMYSNVQAYINTLYKTGDDIQLNNMKKISETVLKYNPDSVESLSNLAIVCMLQKQPEKALDYLLKAHKLAPDDIVVLNNIAYAYVLTGSDKKAFEYYNKVIVTGTVEDKEYAEGMIKKYNLKKE